MDTKPLSNETPGKKILVVEDDNSVRSFLVFSLKNVGFEVHEASTAETALKAITSLCFDLILLDIMLPKMDGFSMCASVRSNKKSEKVPIIFVTAYGKSDLLEKAKEAGAQGVIEKPVMFDELYRQVLEALSGQFTMPTRLKFGQGT